jgi:hypothetical protein
MKTLTRIAFIVYTILVLLNLLFEDNTHSQAVVLLGIYWIFLILVNIFLKKEVDL